MGFYNLWIGIVLNGKLTIICLNSYFDKNKFDKFVFPTLS